MSRADFLMVGSRLGQDSKSASFCTRAGLPPPTTALFTSRQSSTHFTIPLEHHAVHISMSAVLHEVTELGEGVQHFALTSGSASPWLGELDRTRTLLSSPAVLH